MEMEEIQKKIQQLKSQLVGDMLKDMDLKNEIHQLEMKLKGTLPMKTEIECIGCSS